MARERERARERIPVKAILEARDIQQLLLMRYPILYVDRILEIEGGRRIVGVKNFTVNEPFFTGHFPGYPVVPGTVLIEAMAQVGGVFVSQCEAASAQKIMYLAGLDRVRFRKPVVPGDQVVFDLELLKRRREIWKVRGVASVEGERVMEAVLIAAVKPMGPQEAQR